MVVRCATVSARWSDQSPDVVPPHRLPVTGSRPPSTKWTNPTPDRDESSARSFTPTGPRLARALTFRLERLPQEMV